MDANTLKQQLSENDILNLLSELGAEPYQKGNQIIARTICHDGGSHKLYYYMESHSMMCYTHCGSMDIYALVQQVKGIEFGEAYRFVRDFFGYTSDTVKDFSEVLDMSFFNRFNNVENYESLPVIDDNLLKIFNNIYHYSWLKDGILPSIAKKYGIKMSILSEQIVIPHHNIDGGLVGIRVRNLKEDLVEQGKKYMPLYWRGKGYNHATGANLYGLNITKNNIEKVKKVVLFEGEKSVLTLDSFYNGSGIGVAMSGGSLSSHQVEILKQLDIEEVVIATDKEFEDIGSRMEKFYAEKIKKTIADKLLPYYRVSVIWDTENLLELKDSPVDKGLTTWLKLWENRINIID